MKVKTKDGTEMNVQFEDTFFESFEGTDEELQQLMQEIIDMVKNGTLEEQAELINVEEMTEDEIKEFEESLEKAKKRTLQ